MISENMNEHIHTRVGETFKIRLEGNPTTGFLWEAVIPESAEMINFLDTSWEEGNAFLAGEPRIQVLSFQALLPGEMNIILKYKRPWEKDNVLDERIFTIHVNPISSS